MKLFFPAIALLSLASCTTTAPISVMHPAEISIPADLDSVLIVDRTKVAKGNGKQVGNVLEGLFTGEPIGGDKYGRRGCLENLEFIIASNERLSFAHREIIEIENTNGNFDNKAPLKSDFLDSICEQYGADGVIALEHFDSDRDINRNGTPVGQAFVTTKWRLYYPGDQSIVDNFDIRTYGQGYRTSFFDPPTQYRAIYNAGAQAADFYMKRIVPCIYMESRMYYTSGSKEMRIAAKHAKNGNWGEAMFMYENVINSNASPKLLKRAAYNMAVASEMAGDLDKALSWANKASRTGSNAAISYVRILQTQINQKPLVEEQLKHE